MNHKKPLNQKNLNSYCEGSKLFHMYDYWEFREKKTSNVASFHDTYFSAKSPKYKTTNIDGVKRFNISTDFRIQFENYAKQWKKETGKYSVLTKITGNNNYLDIIGIGLPAVPLILEDLKKEADFWHYALLHITKENPVAPEHLGDIEATRNDWLDWGRKKNLID